MYIKSHCACYDRATAPHLLTYVDNSDDLWPVYLSTFMSYPGTDHFNKTLHQISNWELIFVIPSF